MLRSAFRGEDIEWWDEEEEELMQDEGSGAEYGEYEDDEDGFREDADNLAGSGDGEEEEDIIIPDWISDKEQVKDKWSPWPKNPPTLRPDPVTEPPTHHSSGATSVHLKDRVEVARAVITYFLPLATCYFGGFLADTPWSSVY